MPKVSVIIPSRNEQFLPATVQDVLSKARGDIEVIAILDGYWPEPALPENPRLKLVHFDEARGMRPGINAGAAIATGDYLLKLDAHCMVAEGFDVTLTETVEDDWVVVPRRYSLDPHNWAIQNTGKSPVDAHFLSYPFQLDKPGHGLHGTVWRDRARGRQDILLDDEMSSQGSCWFSSKKHWERVLGPMNNRGYGNFVQEFQEIGMKTWLSGGRVVCNKSTWYAHLHKGKEFGRGYFISKREMSDGAKYCVDFWMNNRWDSPLRVHDMKWFIEKFWPVPGWPTNADGTLNWAPVEENSLKFAEEYKKGILVMGI